MPLPVPSAEPHQSVGRPDGGFLNVDDRSGGTVGRNVPAEERGVLRVGLERHDLPLAPHQPRRQERIIADVCADIQHRAARADQLREELRLLPFVRAQQDAQNLAAAGGGPKHASHPPLRDRHRQCVPEAETHRKTPVVEGNCRAKEV